MKEANKYESPQMNFTMMETFSMIAASGTIEEFELGEEIDFVCCIQESSENNQHHLKDNAGYFFHIP